jgi:hypothetical protein
MRCQARALCLWRSQGRVGPLGCARPLAALLVLLLLVATQLATTASAKRRERTKVNLIIGERPRGPTSRQ